VRRDRRIELLRGIGDEEGGTGAYWDEVLILDCIRSRVSGNIDCHQSIPFVGRGGIKTEKPIPVDRRGFRLEWRRWKRVSGEGGGNRSSRGGRK